ncbi:MAG: hypothetical protein ACPGWM_04935 [Flavobacteriales bacterium]
MLSLFLISFKNQAQITRFEIRTYLPHYYLDDWHYSELQDSVVVQPNWFHPWPEQRISLSEFSLVSVQRIDEFRKHYYSLLSQEEMQADHSAVNDLFASSKFIFTEKGSPFYGDYIEYVTYFYNSNYDLIYIQILVEESIKDQSSRVYVKKDLTVESGWRYWIFLGYSKLLLLGHEKEFSDYEVVVRGPWFKKKSIKIQVLYNSSVLIDLPFKKIKNIDVFERGKIVENPPPIQIL